MKVDFAEIGIGKIGISDYFYLKYRFLANFGKIGNKNFSGIPYFFTQNPLQLSPVIGIFVPILAKKVL